MSAGDWPAWRAERIGAIERAGRWREPRVFDALGPVGRLVGPDGTGREVVSFASNDYLGLSAHPAVRMAAIEAAERWGTGAGASRLVTGTRPVHAELEAALAEHRGCERAVVFPTGFAANLGVLTVFGDAGCTVFSDELNHASIIDACRLSRATPVVVPHLDLGALDRALGACTGRALVVSDVVFSMDGDAADVAGLAEIAGRHGALLVLDEAHAVVGPDVGGLLAGTSTEVLRVGTLSKTLGSLGGYVAGTAEACALIENCARPYIFTTGLSPTDAGAALAALGVLRSEEGARLVARLESLIERVAPGHGSPIVPVVIGDEADALAASADLLDLGLWVPAIRPPTVAPGTSRLRVTLSAAHRDEDVERLRAALERVRERWGSR